MKPLTSLVPFAKWLLRISFAAFAYIVYFNDAIDFSGYFAQVNIIAAIVVILAVLLLAGGLLNKPSLTVISGLLILILFVFLMFSPGSSLFAESEADPLKNILEKIIPASIGFYFMARGNKG